MDERKKYIKAVYEIWKFKHPNLPGNDYYSQVVPNDKKTKKLGIFVYDYRAEVKTFDRCSVNPLGAIVNKRL